jgi:hypothetical protein
LQALIALANDRRAFQPPERYAHRLAEIAALRQEPLWTAEQA